MNIVIFSRWVQQVGEKGSQADVIKCYLILKYISVTLLTTTMEESNTFLPGGLGEWS